MLMSHRFILYDALKSLYKGHSLIVCGEDSIFHYLEGCPLVHNVTIFLIENEYVKLDGDSEIHYIITPKGRHAFLEGERLYKKMTFLSKLKGRLGFDVDWR